MRLERFSTVWALEIVLPHLVYHSQGYKCKRKNQAREECSVGVEYEDEIVHIDHFVKASLAR